MADDQKWAHCSIDPSEVGLWQVRPRAKGVSKTLPDGWVDLTMSGTPGMSKTLCPRHAAELRRWLNPPTPIPEPGEVA